MAKDKNKKKPATAPAPAAAPAVTPKATAPGFPVIDKNLALFIFNREKK